MPEDQQEAHCHRKRENGQSVNLLPQPCIGEFMSVIAVTTNEPRSIKVLFPDAIETPLRYDMSIYAELGIAGIERKKIPSDLLASIEDGRLRRELIAMREECDFSILLLHGKFRFKDDILYDGKHPTRWNRKGIRNMLRTLEWVEGCFIEYAVDNIELVDTVHELAEYLDDKSHFSLKGRPGIQKIWAVPTKLEKIVHFYDGLPGIAAVRARALALRFPDPLQLYEASVDDISSIRGFGKSAAIEIHNFLRGK